MSIKDFRVELPAVYEAKSSIGEYLLDPCNMTFNTACHDVLMEYYDGKRIADIRRDGQILRLFRLSYQIACYIRDMQYAENWGDVYERDEVSYYRLPDGTDIEKEGLSLNLLMPLLYYLLKYVKVGSIEKERRENFMKTRKYIYAGISLKFNQAPDEKAIFNMFKEKFEGIPNEECSSMEPYSEREVFNAIKHMNETIESKAAWRGVVNALVELEGAGLYKAKHRRTRSGECIKFLALDIAGYLGEEESKFCNAVKCARGDYSYVSNKFKLILKEGRTSIS